MLPESGYLEAAGAAIAASKSDGTPLPDVDAWVKPTDAGRFPKRPPLSQFSDRVVRFQDPGMIPPPPGVHFILGVDAGSTTTKAILLDRDSGRIAARCYLRTHGNPVHATFECITDLERQVGGVPHRVVQAAVNRQGILHSLRGAYRRVFVDATRLELIYDVCHNIAKRESYQVAGCKREVLVHRNGATRAFPPGHREVPPEYREVGQPVFIPGSMGTASLVLVGR